MNKNYFLNFNSDDIIKYFSEPREENEHIEFKNGNASVDKLHKEICAFANTGGGILIWGTPEENNDRICSGDIIGVKVNKSKDDLLASFSGKITPMIRDIEINIIEINKERIYIIYVPDSIQKPHQHNHKYYIRLGTMSQPAPHSIVQAMFKQRLNIELELNITHGLMRLSSEDKKLYHLGINVTNKTRIPAQKVEMYFALTGRITQEKEKGWEEKKDSHLYNLESIHLRSGYKQLSKICSFNNAIIDRIWNWYNAFDIKYLNSEYFYLEVHLWAEEVPAIYKSYKVYKNFLVEEVDLEGDTTEKLEYEKWTGKSIKNKTEVSSIIKKNSP